jgi:hypothetical protein
MSDWPDRVNGVPNISGHEAEVAQATAHDGVVFRDASAVDFGSIRSAFAIALHQHQPLIPAGGDDLSTAAVISNLQYMMEHPDEGDNHNAPVFAWCYERIADFVPELVHQGHHPRIMLDYSGTLLHGLANMGREDILDKLRTVTCNDDYKGCVEWLGMPWGHPVAPSTPAADFALHVRAWQQHFAALFGLEALSRVKGFSPAEMALPNEPDVAYSFVKTLRDAGYWWVLVQEHTVEQENGNGVERPHLPHRLVCTNSTGETASIVAIVKTQGSDTKLVAQMQPFHEAKGLERTEQGTIAVPPIVTQIGDGENGGVMMNEFPDMFRQTMAEASGSDTPPMNVTEYLEFVVQAGLREEDFPVLRPLFQKRIWDRMEPGEGPDKLHEVTEQLRREDERFHMEGGSWTNDRSWVEGYDDVIGPMERASAAFHETLDGREVDTDEHRYRNALYHLLISQTSCYRYWGEGRWTEYGKELCRRLQAILENDF